LTDNATGSSGEAITIAFKNRPNTKSLGLPTCGLSTANQGFTLSDKGQLLLTTSTMADRNSNKYGAEVAPDLMESDPSLMVQKAVEWILN
jgi:carboxyl-terminal processing protease